MEIYFGILYYYNLNNKYCTTLVTRRIIFNITNIQITNPYKILKKKRSAFPDKLFPRYATKTIISNISFCLFRFYIYTNILVSFYRLLTLSSDIDSVCNIVNDVIPNLEEVSVIFLLFFHRVDVQT